MVRVLCSLALAVGLAAVPASAPAAPKFAVVDVEAVFEASGHWKKAVGALQKEMDEKQKALEARQKQLRERKEKLDAQKAVSDPNTSSAAEDELYKDGQEMMQGFLSTQQKLKDREKKMTDQMLSRVEIIVRDIAANGDYDFVFESGPKEKPNVLYAPKSHDITPKVIEEYKKRFKDKPLEM